LVDTLQALRGSSRRTTPAGVTPAEESALSGQPEPQDEAAGELTPEEEGPVNAPVEARQVEPMETADLGGPPAPACAPSRAASEAEVVPSPEGRAVGAVPPVPPSGGATAEPLLGKGAIGPAPRSSPRREYLPYHPAYPENDRYLQPEQWPDRRRHRGPTGATNLRDAVGPRGTVPGAPGNRRLLRRSGPLPSKNASPAPTERLRGSRLRPGIGFRDIG